MSSHIHVWIARDKDSFCFTHLHLLKPSPHVYGIGWQKTLNLTRFTWLAGDWGNQRIELPRHHGLKPGQIKKATISFD